LTPRAGFASLWSWSNLSLLYELIAFWSPVTGGLKQAVSAGLRALPWLLGSYTIAFGTLLLTLSAQLERLSRDRAEEAQPA